MGGICRSAASTAIITGFLAVVTRLLDQVQYTAVFINGLRWTDKMERWRDPPADVGNQNEEMAPRTKKKEMRHTRLHLHVRVVLCLCAMLCIQSGEPQSVL